MRHSLSTYARAVIIAIMGTVISEWRLDAQPQPTPRTELAAAGQHTTVLAELAPTGRLRAAIIVNQPVYATKDPATGKLSGVTIDLGQELAARLAVPFVPVEYASQAGIVEDLEAGRVDIAILAITADPKRARTLDFTPPFFQTESTYLVPAGSRIQSLAEVDQPGVRVVVNRGAALDVLLSKTLKYAEVVRVGPGEAVKTLRAGGAEAYAANRTALLGAADQLPGARVLEGWFSATPSGIAIVKGRRAGLAYLTDFVKELKASGFVRQAIDRAGLRGVSVAPEAGQ